MKHVREITDIMERTDKAGAAGNGSSNNAGGGDATESADGGASGQQGASRRRHRRRVSTSVGELQAKVDRLREDKDAAIEYFAKKKVGDECSTASRRTTPGFFFFLLFFCSCKSCDLPRAG